MRGGRDAGGGTKGRQRCKVWQQRGRGAGGSNKEGQGCSSWQQEGQELAIRGGRVQGMATRGSGVQGGDLTTGRQLEHIFGPVRIQQAHLRLHGHLHRGSHRGEGDVEGVALGVDLIPIELSDALMQQLHTHLTCTPHFSWQSSKTNDWPFEQQEFEQQLHTHHTRTPLTSNTL